jgi:hypothetical protein
MNDFSTFLTDKLLITLFFSAVEEEKKKEKEGVCAAEENKRLNTLINPVLIIVRRFTCNSIDILPH